MLLRWWPLSRQKRSNWDPPWKRRRCDESHRPFANGATMMQKLVVVGNGMAGVACVEQILKHAPKFEITIFGDETHVNYNRILLSSVLAGEKAADEIVLNGLEWYRKHGIELRLGVRIVDVDSECKSVTGDDGSVTPFDKLLVATGSTPLIPPMEGVKKEGVFVFRNLDDTRCLLDYAGPGKKAVVIGGGLRRDGRSLDGHAHGTPARLHGRQLLESENGMPGRESTAGAQYGGHSREWQSNRRSL